MSDPSSDLESEYTFIFLLGQKSQLKHFYNKKNLYLYIEYGYIIFAFSIAAVLID